MSPKFSIAYTNLSPAAKQSNDFGNSWVSPVPIITPIVKSFTFSGLNYSNFPILRSKTREIKNFYI